MTKESTKDMLARHHKERRSLNTRHEAERKAMDMRHHGITEQAGEGVMAEGEE